MRRVVRTFSVLALLAGLVPAIGPAGPAGANVAGTTGRLAFMSDRDGNLEVYTSDADGTNQTRLTNNPGSDSFPAWSPDGSTIAFVSDRDGSFDVFTMNADGTDVTNLTNTPNADEGFPAYAPTGDRIAFTSDRADPNPGACGQNCNFEIFEVDADDGGNVERLTNAPGFDTDPTYSPSGTHIAFVSSRDGDFEIYRMDPDGGQQTNLTNSPLPQVDPDYRPDGGAILFASVDADSIELFLMDQDGANRVQLTQTPAGVTNRLPSVTPESDGAPGGDRLYFMRQEDPGAGPEKLAPPRPTRQFFVPEEVWEFFFGPPPSAAPVITDADFNNSAPAIESKPEARLGPGGCVVLNGKLFITAPLLGNPEDPQLGVRIEIKRFFDASEEFPSGRLAIFDGGQLVKELDYDSITSIEMTGGPGNDVLALDDDVDKPATISGGRGDDQIGGGSGPTTLSGGGGDDFVVGSTGGSTMEGGSGDDFLRTEGGENSVDAGVGDDRVTVKSGSTAKVFGGFGDDDIHVRSGGTAGLNSVNAGSGNDRISVAEGGTGGRPVRAKAKTEVYRGGPGNDRLFGSPGAERLLGGGGKDVARGRGGDDVVRGGGGRDRVFGQAGDDNLHGQKGNDLVKGGPGKDTLKGGPGRDVCRGGPGQDRIFVGGPHACEVFS